MTSDKTLAVAMTTFLNIVDKEFVSGRVLTARGLCRGLKTMLEDDSSMVIQANCSGETLQEFLISRCGMDAKEFIYVGADENGDEEWR